MQVPETVKPEDRDDPEWKYVNGMGLLSVATKGSKTLIRVSEQHYEVEGRPTDEITEVTINGWTAYCAFIKADGVYPYVWHRGKLRKYKAVDKKFDTGNLEFVVHHNDLYIVSDDYEDCPEHGRYCEFCEYKYNAMRKLFTEDEPRVMHGKAEAM